MAQHLLTRDDITDLRAAATQLVYPNTVHSGDCAGTLCATCGHCAHSVEDCSHACSPVGGCAVAMNDTTVDRVRRLHLALDAAEDALGTPVLSDEDVKRYTDAADARVKEILAGTDLEAPDKVWDYQDGFRDGAQWLLDALRSEHH